jgi:coenzyme F420-0:L-glutamate ligase/coenzyme F420-1:gamma-L-glutamate ligase
MLQVWAVDGIPEIGAGDDLARIIGDALAASGPAASGLASDPAASGLAAPALADGDIIAVTSKIVSKAEGRQVQAADREDSITAETVRVVATREHPGGTTRIVENRLGLVLAAAGVDSSNAPDGIVLLLPLDPDASARELAAALRARFSVRVGVVISDTLGRPWRVGQTDIAIGAAGIRVLDDLRGSTDASGKRLDVTVAAVADEIASAADLVKGKASGRPVAVVRGLAHLVADLDAPGARAIVRPSDEDMFRLGTKEAWEEGYEAGLRAAGPT